MDDEKKTSEPGVLLPGIDPAVGEAILAMLRANPDAHPAALITAAVTGAPTPEAAIEMVSAMLEILMCWQRGHLVWVATKAQDILTGVRHSSDKSGVMFGNVRWPHIALAAGPPKSVRINIPGGFRRVWFACEGLGGAIVRQSEAIALANVMVEDSGGRIVEDRAGPEVLRDAVIEDKQTAKSRARAEARRAIERLYVDAPKEKEVRFRVPLAEAVPGTLLAGMVVYPEGNEGNRYEVESRVNDSWVIVASLPGGKVQAPCAWVAASGPFDFGPHAGFTDEESR